MIVMEAFGRALALEPYLATVVLGGGFLRHGGSDARKRRIGAEDRFRRDCCWPSRIPSGRRATISPTSRRRRRRRRRLRAQRRKEPGAARRQRRQTDRLRRASPATSATGTASALFLVDARREGVSRRGYPTMDGLRAAEVTLTGVQGRRRRGDRRARQGLSADRARRRPAIAALAAEAVGAMAAMHELTVDYLKTRRQFGVPIGSFQALQHRAAEMLIALEQARSMAMLATMMASEENAPSAARRSPPPRCRSAAPASSASGATQLHGGIGMTMEYKVGHYFKRITMIDKMLGDADHHLAALARMGGIVGKARAIDAAQVAAAID